MDNQRIDFVYVGYFFYFRQIYTIYLDLLHRRLSILIILVSAFIYAQNDSYLDSLENSMEFLSKKSQLKKIRAIPYTTITSNISKSELLLKKGIVIATGINDSLSLAEVYQKLSTLYAFSDKRDKKIEYSLKSISIYEGMGEIEKAGSAYGDLGYTIKYENVDKAFYYMRKAIKLLEQLNNNKINHVYDNYGSLLLINKINDSAIYYHKKSLKISKELQDSISLGYNYAHLSTAYSVINKHTIAKKFIDSSTVIRRKINDIYGIAVNYTHTADINFNELKFKEAIGNYQSSAILAKENKYQHLEKYCYEYIAKSYVEIDDYKNAFKYNSKFQSLKDSVLNEQTNKKIAELEVEFETEKKEKEIAVQKEEIKSKNLYGILLGSGLLLLSIISLGAYKYQRTKRKQLRLQLDLKDQLALTKTKNKLQEQRLHISRDLHDNIGSQLTFIISSIDNLKFLTTSSDEKLKNKLSDINNFASSTISQLRDTIWAMNKNEISYEDFYGRLLTFIEKAKLVKEDIKFTFSSSITSSPKFSSVEGINIFRVIQESINNAIKYADASKINVQLSENHEYIAICIEDNGIGFDINEIEIGNGLNNMQHRMSEINGIISVNSKPTIGTKISLQFPKNT